jgi:hypothetical protein
MITEEQIDLLIEKLISRIQDANIYFLQKIGNNIKKIRNLKPSEAQQLIQILKYNGNYEDIINEIAKYTNLNVKDIDEIFSAYAKKDMMFSKQFYEYRNIPFVESEALKAQRLALTEIAKNEMYNFTRNNVLGYTIRDVKGRPQFYGLRETYNRVLDEALLNVGQGKETFDSAMTRIMKDIGGSGLKTIEYESGRSMRLDSAVRMHLKGRLRELHNENQKIIGEEIGTNGVEISTHSHPAPDHLMQGHQFSNEEFEKLQSGQEATDYKGKKFTLDHDGKNGYRPISEMNCYHYIFSIVLGVSEPEYNDKQLKEIIDSNNKGFEFEGKHYSLYEGQQLLRKVELELRKSKDTQILARSSNNAELVGEMQSRITQLTSKYRDILKASGLKSKLERAKVSGYRRVAKSKLK